MVSKTIQIDDVDVAQLIEKIHHDVEVPGLIKTDQFSGKSYKQNYGWMNFFRLKFESEHVEVTVFKREGSLITVDARDDRFARADLSNVFWGKYSEPEDIDVEGLAAAIQQADSRNEGDSHV